MSATGVTSGVLTPTSGHLTSFAGHAIIPPVLWDSCTITWTKQTMQRTAFGTYYYFYFPSPERGCPAPAGERVTQKR